MTEPERTTPTKWHESVASMFEALIVLLLLTSPCWGLALLAWVSRD